MPHATVIDEALFRQSLEEKLGAAFAQARTIFENYGPSLSFDVTTILLHAVDRNKVTEVLGILEKHWNEHLSFQHPQIRGQVAIMGSNPTQVMFETICKDVLGLTPTA